MPRTSVTNILIVGAGGAGLRAAIAAHECGVEVTVLGKRRRNDAHTVLAAGGINAALGTVDPQDSPEQHFVDTMKDGYFLGNPRTVEILVREAPERVLELAEWGCPFARTDDGKLDQRYFGAHRYRRTCYAGDFTGRAILGTLLEQVRERRIPILENRYVSRLLVHDGQCFGALAFDLDTGERTVHLADAVILCTGGHTRIWRRSSSRRDENTGDGMWLAAQAGCRLMDLELVQFHPTGMIVPEEVAGTLVTEAVRGEGGRLYNSRGERFMERYDPKRLELSTRDRVALANYTEIKEGRGTENGGVLLDISHQPKELILEKLPRMYRQFLEISMLDISETPMEVAPTAHYTMGGVVVDPETHATDVAGLYAAGEVTAGLHGANRLGGNSLAEILVFGRRAGIAAAEFSQALEAQLRSRRAIREAEDELDELTTPGEELARPLQRQIRDLMTDHCGVVRDEEGLTAGLEKIRAMKGAERRVDVRPSSEGFQDLGYALDLRAARFAAETTILGALERRETRGAHNRSDFPEPIDALRVNLVARFLADRLEITHQKIPAVRPGLQAMLDADRDEYEAEGRLLE
jgi:succinate dehydrogenase / fumarate reductase, flavoprotein subunit